MLEDIVIQRRLGCRWEAPCLKFPVLWTLALAQVSYSSQGCLWLTPKQPTSRAARTMLGEHV